MDTYAIDLESSYSKDHSIELFGSLNYLAHPETDIYLLAVAGDNGFRWSGRPESFNWDLLKSARVIAHNYGFDGAIFEAWNLARPETFNCTANLSGYFGSPHALDLAAKKLLGVSVSKSLRGKMKGREWGSLQQEEQNEMARYCENDAQLCLALWQKHSSEWPDTEQQLSRMTIKMCHLGIRIDQAALDDMNLKAQEIMGESLLGIPWAASREEKPLSLVQARRECAKAGIPAPDSFAEKDEELGVWEETYGEAYPFVRAVRDYRKANILYRKLETIERRTKTNGRLHYDLRYWGAHTGRWAGAGGLNMQNLAKYPWRDIYLRSLLIPEEGKKFVICDLSAIEPRVLAYISGDQNLLAALREGFGVYEAQAISWNLWKGEKGTLDATNPGLYGFIKSLSLGCGYGMGPIRFRSVCSAAGIQISPAEARSRVDHYRKHNPRVIALWHRLDHELHRQRSKGHAELQLPSGRQLIYPDLIWQKGGLWSTIQRSDGYRPTKLWGGVITENAVQAIARDIFAHQLLALENAGIRVVMHSHDEAVCEVGRDVTKEEIVQLMTQAPEWIKELPLGAKAKETQRYAK
jgi:DNA polymerase I-like protein with 3'-5' exonuclease and polymerase domains